MSDYPLHSGDSTMSGWTVIFPAVVIVAVALGLYAFGSGNAAIAQVSALGFIVLFVIALMLRRTPAPSDNQKGTS
jgi:uncharacterized membrane protein YtjA (UPF0391 family)